MSESLRAMHGIRLIRALTPQLDEQDRIDAKAAQTAPEKLGEEWERAWAKAMVEGIIMWETVRYPWRRNDA